MNVYRDCAACLSTTCPVTVFSTPTKTLPAKVQRFSFVTHKSHYLSISKTKANFFTFSTTPGPITKDVGLFCWARWLFIKVCFWNLQASCSFSALIKVINWCVWTWLRAIWSVSFAFSAFISSPPPHFIHILLFWAGSLTYPRNVLACRRTTASQRPV